MISRASGLRVLFNFIFNVEKIYIPKYLTAAVLFKINRRLKVINLKIPKLKEGQVLVKIYYSGICGSQIKEIFGGRENKKWLPHLLGHEASGKIIKIGRSVKKVKLGDEVILTWIKSKGFDAKNANFFYKKKRINSGKVTTFGNYVVVSENRVVKKPKDIGFKEAVLFGCAFPTGAGMVLNETKVSKDDGVVLIGLGAIGLCTLLALKEKKVKRIAVIDYEKKRLNLAKKLGVKYLFSTINDITNKKILKLFNGKIDICFESAGTTKTIEFGIKITKSNGKVHFASHPNNKEFIHLKPHDLILGKKISGTWGGGSKPDRDIKKFYSILKNNSLFIKNLMTKVYYLNDINRAISEFKNRSILRPLIKMEH